MYYNYIYIVNVPTFPQSSWSSFPFSSIQHVTIVHGHNSIDGRSPLAAEGWAGGDRFGSETQGVALHWCGQGTPELNIKGIIFTLVAEQLGCRLKLLFTSILGGIQVWGLINQF